VTNAVGRATSTSTAMRRDAETPTDPAPAKIIAKPASGVLRRGSFKVTYAGTGKLNARAGQRVIATGTATLKLTSAGRKLLKRKHGLTVTVTVGRTSTRVKLRA
jgi:hypothetical protein